MAVLKSIIVEDEPLAASLLELYIERYEGVENIGSFRNAVDAALFLEGHKVDLIFLDIHLPNIRGFEFMKRLKKPYHIILTTAYSEYALEGFDEGVIDYLLKPILFERFEVAVDRLINLLGEGREDESLVIQINKSKIKLIQSDIYYIESSRGYVNIYDNSQQLYRTKMSTVAILEMLSSDFIRIHKSFIINKKRVTEMSKNTIVLDHQTILPIGRKYKDAVLSSLEDLF